MAYSIYVKFEGIDGEVVREGFEKQVEATSLEWGLENPARIQAGQLPGPGKTAFRTLRISKRIDRSSPTLAYHLTAGKHLPTVDISFMTADRGEARPFLNYKLHDVLVVGRDLQVAAGGEPEETIQLAFVGMVETAARRAPDGRLLGQATRAGWNVGTNRPQP
jgi:type VI secretion system secreted protein Hcp